MKHLNYRHSMRWHWCSTRWCQHSIQRYWHLAWQYQHLARSLRWYWWLQCWCNSVDQYGISFLRSNIHPWHIFAEKGPSVTAWQIFEFVHFWMNLHGISNECNLNQIFGASCEYRVSTLLYLFTINIFVRNLTLHHFLLSPEVWNICVSINRTVTS